MIWMDRNTSISTTLMTMGSSHSCFLHTQRRSPCSDTTTTYSSLTPRTKQTVITCLSCTSLAAQTRASHLISDLHLLRQRRLKITPSLSSAFVDSILTTLEALSQHV